MWINIICFVKVSSLNCRSPSTVLEDKGPACGNLTFIQHRCDFSLFLHVSQMLRRPIVCEATIYSLIALIFKKVTAQVSSRARALCSHLTFIRWDLSMREQKTVTNPTIGKTGTLRSTRCSRQTHTGKKTPEASNGLKAGRELFTQCLIRHERSQLLYRLWHIGILFVTLVKIGSHFMNHLFGISSIRDSYRLATQREV